ncbi:lytic transglycosylase [Meridianimarinicoccus roseus]|uniref:Lytic transglycosylase n=1 Tax=Meridianimarinicoccus roseus TaxID=2072018 RepID=A0A2V2LKC7_9RHOB|nr:lytic transglycosylase domain-containing protein [Meridianimarinicoccus roseus]PWR02759.1 lytic transglycosylase [Meridianimarinicoccus roseus]
MHRWVKLGLALGLLAGPAQADLSAAMDHVRARDWPAAAAAARRGGEIPLAVADWHRLRSGQGSLDEYLAFLRAYPDWPGLPLMLRRGEQAIAPSAPAADVIAYFSYHLPQTSDGVLRLAAALEEAGRGQDAQALAVLAWRSMTLGAEAENVLMARYGVALADHHVARMDELLWRGALDAAARQRPRVPEGWRLLHDARVALRGDEPGVDARIAAVPDALAGDPGLAFERMEWRARKGREDGVIEILLDRSTTAERLGRPEVWAPRRRLVARTLFGDGRTREAYLVASQNFLSEGADFADLEWLSGYLALRRLDSPAAALAHFRRFRAGVTTPVSLGRAGYWEGRAHEALGQAAEAAAAYAFGAEFQTSFYGQLAAERAGLPLDPRLTGHETFPVARDSAIAASSVYRAGVALHEAGELTLAARFFAHMAESRDRGEIGRLLSLTEQLGAPYIQLQIAKRAADYGHTFHRDYFPLERISVEGRPGVTRELALAIARRESEFNPTVVSPAGARGLMQVMPATASDVARELGMEYSLARLTADPDYNAALGTAYLAGLVAEFGNNPILVSAGYNAGPARARQWLRELGDPRAPGADVVDWIEAIPYRETRNYVMRVSESLAPYRARLSGQTGPVTLSAELAGR